MVDLAGLRDSFSAVVKEVFIQHLELLSRAGGSQKKKKKVTSLLKEILMVFDN